MNSCGHVCQSKADVEKLDDLNIYIFQLDLKKSYLILQLGKLWKWLNF